jgi:hypothetical protein
MTAWWYWSYLQHQANQQHIAQQNVQQAMKNAKKIARKHPAPK